jgi:hypothetical protein
LRKIPLRELSAAAWTTEEHIHRPQIRVRLLAYRRSKYVKGTDGRRVPCTEVVHGDSQVNCLSSRVAKKRRKIKVAQATGTQEEEEGGVIFWFDMVSTSVCDLNESAYK